MVQASSILDRVLVLEMVRVTEAAAIAASKLVGRGDEKAADAAAVEAMRLAFNDLYMDGTVVIGEGERDEAPMLFIGERVGRSSDGDFEVDIACDPLEGTTLCATGVSNAISVIAIAEKGGFLRAPDTYMDKIACGPGYPKGVIDLDKTPAENVQALAKAKVAPESIDRVFLTGGSSLIPAIRDIFFRRFGHDRIATGGELTSIAHGLALVGQEANLTEWAA
jgi:fructose-1,6-bisphosphatase II / sedoheptulose-1,7-bisphosphatase